MTEGHVAASARIASQQAMARRSASESVGSVVVDWGPGDGTGSDESDGRSTAAGFGAPSGNLGDGEPSGNVGVGTVVTVGITTSRSFGAAEPAGTSSTNPHPATPTNAAAATTSATESRRPLTSISLPEGPPAVPAEPDDPAGQI